jgi:hypothetical protein
MEVSSYLRKAYEGGSEDESLKEETLSIVFGQNESDDVMYEDSAQKLSIAFVREKCVGRNKPCCMRSL